MCVPAHAGTKRVLDALKAELQLIVSSLSYVSNWGPNLDFGPLEEHRKHL